jgi:hypothetical protein
MKSKVRNRKSLIAFTLIELLVVITIIVLLLALLAPALERAIYQAELLQCAGRLKVVGGGVTQYAMDYRRFYPPRWAAQAGDQPHALADNLWDVDDRPYFVGYFHVNLLLDPFLPAIDLEIDDQDSNPQDDAQRVFSHYALWWGWKFDSLPAQRKIGDRFTWRHSGTEHGFDVLVGDYDEQRHDVSRSYSTHPDHDGTMRAEITDGQQSTLGHLYLFARWIGDLQRGPLDLNWAHQDLSVRRVGHVRISDPDALVAVPQTGNSAVTWPVWFTRLPRP